MAAIRVILTYRWTLYWHADCIFTNWTGAFSPLVIKDDSSANVVDTVFRSMRLDVELADVSFGGHVRFENVKLANVSLNLGKVVSTSFNNDERDYAKQVAAVDGEDYDVEYTPVPVGERSMFGEEFLIDDQIMSDCLCTNASAGVPECPLVPAQRRHETSRQDLKKCGVGNNRYENIEEFLLTEDSLRRLQEHAGLKPMPPPPAGWPPFNTTPPANSVMRTSLSLPLPTPPGTAVPALVLTPEAAAVAKRAMQTTGQPPERGEASRATVVLIVAATLIAGAAAAVVLWTLWSLRCRSPKSWRRFLNELKRPWRRRLPFWTVRNLSDSHTVYAVLCGTCMSTSVFH